MKNVPLLKSEITNSPKTAGGISKSLLTPCRRIGLSRNWRNKGPSPFISPLTSSNPDVKEDKIENRKRKQRVIDEVEKTPETSVGDKIEIQNDKHTDIDKTPSRNSELPRRKKSKVLLSSINKSQEDSVATNDTKQIEEASELIARDHTNTENGSTPIQTQSKKPVNKSPALKSRLTSSKQKPDICVEAIIDNTGQNLESSETIYEIKEKSPNDLKKECIVVIQRKIFKKTKNSDKDDSRIIEYENKKEKHSLTTLSDSDSDEVPLIRLNSKDSIKSKQEVAKKHEQTTSKLEIKDLNENSDFIENTTKTHTSKVKEGKSPKNRLQCNKNKSKEKIKSLPKASSQSSHADDDDDDFDNKKTILIRKTYEKVSKPLKAKSTGSITQKDIDELKARIEAKKKLLLAKSISPDTEELRNLIKKWQKGCQDALMELLDLMKTKCQDKQDMNYSEMLQALKIPPSLVGYDSESDCFNSPDDATIILGQFKDI